MAVDKLDRILLRIPRALKKRVAAKCKAEGHTFTYIGTNLLEGWISGELYRVSGPKAVSGKVRSRIGEAV